MKEAPEQKSIVQEWLRFARENLLFAKAGLKEDFSPYNTVCFLCQGSAEKYLKGFLITRGWRLKKTHDLIELLGAAVEYEHAFTQLKSSAQILNDYISEARYPGDLSFETLTESNATEAVEAAERIEEFVLEKLASEAGKTS